MLRPQSTKLKPHGIWKKKLETRQQTFYFELIKEKKLIIEGKYSQKFTSHDKEKTSTRRCCESKSLLLPLTLYVMVKNKNTSGSAALLHQNRLLLKSQRKSQPLKNKGY